MHCPTCDFDNPPAMRFCGQCGAPLALVCARCSAENPPGFKFCGACGAGLAAVKLPSKPLSLEEQFSTLQQALPASLRDHLLTQPEGENRLVTVLFADMSGSVASTADLHPEEGADLVNRLLKAMVDGLVKYEGRVDRFLGDGVLAVFGTTQAHENDPERAIRAAWEIREAAQALGLRITAGINTGEVYVGEIGSEQHQERTVMGPVVNLAARLQAKAEPGQILVGEATYRQTQRSFGFSALSLEIRGMAGPVRAYAVKRLLPRPEKLRGIEGLRAELIGRDEEFARLREALAEVRRGRGQMVSLIGEAGVGKSRLVAELKQAIGCQPSAVSPAKAAFDLPDSRRLTADSPLWLEGRCLELGMTASYWLFVDLFREYFAFEPEDDDRRRGERIAARLRGLVERGDLSPERLEEIGPLFGHLLSVRFGTEWDERLQHATPEQLRHQTFTAVRDFLAALARQQPVLLVFEDLHWADTLSLDLISLLMDTLTRDPLLLLCAYRPEREHKCWHLGSLAARKCPERYTEITLRELTPAQSRRLVEALLTIDSLPAAVKELILAKARGNPFFVEEVLRSLIDAGMLYREDGAWRAKEGIESLRVPETVQGVILSRVDRLERDLKRVLESASVIGRLFRRRLLEHTLREQTELERVLWQLEERQLIYEERVLPEEEYSFQHVLTQETIYESILRRRRAAFHQRVAEAIEALYRDGLEEFYEQLAYHYERTGSDEKAIEYLLKAGEKSLRAYLSEDAMGYFGRARERLERTGLAEARREWQLQALNGLGKLARLGGRTTEAEEYHFQALALGKQMELPAQELGRLYKVCGETLWVQGRYDEIIQLAEEAMTVLGPESQSIEAALITDMLYIVPMEQGRREEATKLHLCTAAYLERLPYVGELGPVYEHVAMSYLILSKDVEEARRWFRIQESKATQSQDPAGKYDAVYDVGRFITRPMGDLNGAVVQFQDSLAFWLKCGDVLEQARSRTAMAFTYLQLGDLENASQLIQASLERMEGSGYRHHLLGCVMLGQGRLDAAMEAFGKADQIARERGVKDLDEAFALAQVSFAQGQREVGLKQLQEAATRAPADPPRLVLVLGDTPSLARALGALEDAWDDPESFRAFCQSLREARPEAAGSSFAQWFLEPAHPQSGFSILDSELPTSEDQIQNPNAQRAPEIQNGNWIWDDPFGDCSFTLGNGVEIRAVNGRDLWYINLSAPRLLRPADGDLAVQTICIPVSEAKPAIGGLLLWKDKANFLRLERGTRGKREISFQGCIDNKDRIIGRGRLPAERIFLRLERRAGRVSALCSADGQNWFTVGQVEFPVEDPVEVGLHAIGSIDRLVYPGAYSEGTAVRFEMFELWAGEA